MIKYDELEAQREREAAAFEESMDEYLSLSPEEQAEIDAAEDAELDAAAREYVPRPPPEQYRIRRHFVLCTLLGFRGSMRRMPELEGMIRAYVRRSQMSLVKMRAWRAAGYTGSQAVQ